MSAHDCADNRLPNYPLRSHSHPSAAHSGISVSNTPRLVVYRSACKKMYSCSGRGSGCTGRWHTAQCSGAPGSRSCAGGERACGRELRSASASWSVSCGSGRVPSGGVEAGSGSGGSEAAWAGGEGGAALRAGGRIAGIGSPARSADRIPALAFATTSRQRVQLARSS